MTIEERRNQVKSLIKEGYKEVRLLAESDKPSAVEFYKRLVEMSPERRIAGGFGKPAVIMKIIQEAIQKEEAAAGKRTA